MIQGSLRRGVVVIFLVAVYFVSCVGISQAANPVYEPVSIGNDSPVEFSATEGTELLIVYKCGSAACNFSMLLNGEEVASNEREPGGGKMFVSVYVPPGSTFAIEYHGGASVYSAYKVMLPAGGGGEGKEGKTGATGATGPTGPEGKEGKEGKEGAAGAEGKGGSGGSELMSFSTSAQENLSEIKESTETIGWCIVGTILAMGLFFMVYTVLKANRR